MEYHDNEVHFSLDGDYSLINGSYTVDEFSVTPGQDPKGHIKSGMKLSFGSDGSIVFNVGRQGSESVAAWFKSCVSASQTTFNHTPKELNFAFIGTLVLNLTGGILGEGSNIVTFSNVVLAQGHAGASNNWWFGGQSCAYIGDDQVKCLGIDTKGSKVRYVFRRGDNTVNEVKVLPGSTD